MDLEHVLVTRPRPGVTQITLNRPSKMNAMGFEVMAPLRDVLDDVSWDAETRVVVLTGAGAGFCSGADLSDELTPVPRVQGLRPPSVARRAMKILDDVILGLRSMNQPVIGAINGPAIGGGFCLAMATDIRVASAEAYFRAAGINNGLTSAELGISYLLPRAIGSSRAFEIMLTGRDVSAEEAERIGLVSRVVAGDALLDECYALAERIQQFSHAGVEMTKRVLWAGLEAGSLTGHMDHEGLGQLFVRMTTGNFQEAVVARREKRRPQFRD